MSTQNCRLDAPFRLLRSTLARMIFAFAAMALAVGMPSAASAFDAPFAGVRKVTGTLPVLVILLRPDGPSDSPYIPPGTPQIQNLTQGQIDTMSRDRIRRQIFGPRKSVATYFNEISYGAFNIEEAMVTPWLVARDDPSTAVDESSHAFIHTSDIYKKGAWIIRQVEAQTNFRFARYDRNNDGRVTEDELGVIWIYPGVYGGVGRHTDPALVKVPSLGKGVQLNMLARAGDQSNWALIAHEMAHQIFRLGDLYVDNAGYPGVGVLSLMCDQADGTHLDPWAKIKLGWLRPTVVSEDGWYALSDVETRPEALILHDPKRGTKDYFIVENRWPGQSHEDFLNMRGLAIWRISERDSSGDWARRTIDLIWAGGPPTSHQLVPGHCPSRNDALFTGASAATGYAPTQYSAPGRLVWRDGTASGIAIWHIPPASNNARLYVDVPPMQGPSMVGPAVAIIGTTRDLDVHEPPYFFMLPPGRRSDDIVGIGVASDNHVYAWYRDGMVSSGTAADLGRYRPPYAYAIPGGRTPNDILAIDIASDDHVYAWYRDGTVSAGTSRDLSAYRPPAPFTLAPGRAATDIVAIGIAEDDHVYAWYRDGMVSSGTSRELDAYRPVYRSSLPVGRVPDDIIDVGIDTGDRVHTWLKANGTGAPIVVTAYAAPGGVAPGKTATLTVKAADSSGRPLENVAVAVGATAGAFSTSTRFITEENGLAEFTWLAPTGAPSAYDGRVLIEIRATRHGLSDGRGLVDVPILSSSP
jgi:M6 family metalloprotease-like protein